MHLDANPSLTCTQFPILWSPASLIQVRPFRPQNQPQCPPFGVTAKALRDGAAARRTLSFSFSHAPGAAKFQDPIDLLIPIVSVRYCYLLLCMYINTIYIHLYYVSVSFCTYRLSMKNGVFHHLTNSVMLMQSLQALHEESVHLAACSVPRGHVRWGKVQVFASMFAEILGASRKHLNGGFSK